MGTSKVKTFNACIYTQCFIHLLANCPTAGSQVNSGKCVSTECCVQSSSLTLPTNRIKMDCHFHFLHTHTQTPQVREFLRLQKSKRISFQTLSDDPATRKKLLVLQLSLLTLVVYQETFGRLILWLNVINSFYISKIYTHKIIKKDNY